MLCDIKNITDAATVNDYIKTSDGKAKMMTPEQFWDSEGIEYHYNGMVKILSYASEVTNLLWLYELRAL